jgi:hypothetical protein
MKLIRVTYRATFQQPKEGPLNPMGVKINCPLFVEVYQSLIAAQSRWLARTPKVGEWPSEPWPIQSGAMAEQMRLNVVAEFETQLTPWEMWGNPGTKMDSARLLQPEEVEIRENGQIYFKEPK